MVWQRVVDGLIVEAQNLWAKALPEDCGECALEYLELEMGSNCIVCEEASSQECIHSVQLAVCANLSFIVQCLLERLKR